MPSMFPQAFLKAVVITSIAIPAAGFSAFSASPAFAHGTADSVMDKQVRAKRSNGRDNDTATTSQSSGVRSNDGGDRGRRSDDDETVAVDSEAPIQLEFTREIATSSRTTGNKGRGRTDSVVMTELPGFDLADTTPEALENAAPGTMAARLATYRQKRLALLRAADHQDSAYENLTHLSGMDAAGIAATFPGGGHDAAIEKAKETYMTLRSAVDRRQIETQEVLRDITDGRALSIGAVRELHGLLGV